MSARYDCPNERPVAGLEKSGEVARDREERRESRWIGWIALLLAAGGLWLLSMTATTLVLDLVGRP